MMKVKKFSQIKGKKVNNMTLLIAFVLGLITSPFLLLSALAFRSEPKKPPTKEDWRMME